MKKLIRARAPWAGLLIALVLAGAPAHAASHREAPLMTLDPAADITDVYAFVSYDDANLSRRPEDRKATLILNVVPGQEPSSGPNYFSFDDNVLYQFKVDNDRDGRDDLRYEVRFKTDVVSPGQFIATLALPPVTSLDGEGSQGLSRKQHYTVTEVRSCGVRCEQRRPLFEGQILSAVPSNIGPRTMPNYDALAAKGVYVDGPTGIRVFAGQRAETFAIDLGAVFDTLNLRVETEPQIPGVRPPLPVQTAAEDADDAKNPFGANSFSGFNINTIAIEVPVARLTRDGRPPVSSTSTIGLYCTTSRQVVTLRSDTSRLDRTRASSFAAALLKGQGGWKQVSRMGNPLVNELITPIGSKDLWNATEASDEAQFLANYRNLAVAQALQLVSGVPVPPNPREDIVRLLTKYAGQDPDPNVGPFSELLRLDLTVPPTAPAMIRRLGPLAHDASGNSTPDPAGFPNGRRPNDDVTDIVVRVAGGPNYIANFVGDGVGIQEKGVTAEFPFLPTPYDGRNRQHKDPGETKN
ncbi:MAG TPA: DUF4331 domain-containing protein [Candidatus Polarisedimenticolia bacterium]|nr:DUF4331 domain-containing protein [Candidatus Polarisedimenticolia bacterium]